MNSKGKMNLGLPALVFIIVVGVYNAMLFIIAGTEGHGSSFWISYGYMMVAFLSVAVTGLLLNTKGRQAKDWIFGYPIIKHCINYVIVELILSIIFMLVDSMNWNWSVPFLVQLVVLAIYLVFLLSSFMVKNTIDNIEKREKTSTTNMKFLCVDANALVEMVTDPVAKKAVRDLAEEIRYSDPVSNPNLVDLERQIAVKINDMKTFIRYNDTDKLLACCRETTIILKERNDKCKILKG